MRSARALGAHSSHYLLNRQLALLPVDIVHAVQYASALMVPVKAVGMSEEEYQKRKAEFESTTNLVANLFAALKNVLIWDAELQEEAKEQIQHAYHITVSVIRGKELATQILDKSDPYVVVS